MADTTNTEQQEDPQPGRAVPYDRFKAISDRMKTAEAELARLQATPTGEPGTTPGNTSRKGTDATGDPSPNPGVASTAPRTGNALANPPAGDDWQAKHDALAAELSALKRSRLRDRAAVAKGLPLDAADRLQGDTEADLLADADRLLQIIGAGTLRAPQIDGGTPNRTPRDAGAYRTEDLANQDYYRANRDGIMAALRAKGISAGLH